MTGNWPCYRFLQIEAWNACRIFYSLGLARPLQVSKKIFWDIFSKIRFHSFVGLDLEHRLSTHNMVISLELKATKNQKWKNPKNNLECAFEIIGFIWQPSFIWWKLLLFLGGRDATSYILNKKWMVKCWNIVIRRGGGFCCIWKFLFMGVTAKSSTWKWFECFSRVCIWW